MKSRLLNRLVCAIVLCAALCGTTARAEEEELFDLNAIVVKGELYIWNRISDALDLFRCGIGAGADLGVDVAITEYVQAGAMVTNERGVDFPHFVPPLWMVNYYACRPIFRTHEGYRGTLAFGPFRKDWAPSPEGDKRSFARNKWDIRLELAIIAHVYVDISAAEVGDFIVGFVGWDYMGDDQKVDPTELRRPADQFGRGLCNIAFGVVELPLNIIRVTDEEGDMAGISKGTAQGIWRFLTREIVGVVELVTFPFGWTPIIEPEYPIQKTKNSVWTVHRPRFHKRY